jgi:hypothetical protein
MPNAFKKLLLVVSTCLVLLTAQVQGISISEPQKVKELEWGEVLFSYYRGDDLDALIRLLAREQQGLLVEHKHTANIFAAGLLIDLGLPVSAQKRLDLMESNELSEQNKSRLAMVLARVYYRLQLYNETWRLLQSLNENHLDERDVQRRRLMKAQLLFRNKKYVEASEQLESVRYNGNLQLYAEYNNGITLLQLNDPVAHQRGYDILQKVTETQPLDQEQYALKDQAILALALEALRVKDSVKASELLLSLRLDGMVSNEGLLILGWSFAQAEIYDKALIYWLQLSEMNDLLDPAVQEAWLAVPYAYQKQNDYSSALAGYEHAQLSHSRALRELDLLVENEAWRELMEIEQTAEVSFIESSQGFQRQLVGDAEFFELLEQWNQLQRWDNKLQFALTSLTPIKVMLETNEQRFIEKSSEVVARLEEIKALNLEQQQSQLNALFQTQNGKEVAELLLPKSDASIWSRILSAEQTAAIIPPEKLNGKDENLRRFKGVGLWKIHRDSSHNRWQGQRVNDSLAEVMEQLQELISRPRQPLPEALARVDNMGIDGESVTAALSSLKSVYEAKMAARFNSIVKERRGALKNLAEQANVALARLRFRSLQLKLYPKTEDNVIQDSEIFSGNPFPDTEKDKAKALHSEKTPTEKEASLVDLVESIGEQETETTKQSPPQPIQSNKQEEPVKENSEEPLEETEFDNNKQNPSTETVTESEESDNE